MITPAAPVLMKTVLGNGMTIYQRVDFQLAVRRPDSFPSDASQRDPNEPSCHAQHPVPGDAGNHEESQP